MSNNNINKAILSWSTEGVAICTGVNLENHTFYIDSIDKDGYVRRAYSALNAVYLND